MADSRYIDKWFKRCETHKSNQILVIDLMSSDYEGSESSRPTKRILKRNLLELLPSRSRSARGSQIEEESDSESNRTLVPSRDTTSTSTSNEDQANATAASENRHTNFYRFLMTTVIFDDLSFREPFINPDAKGLKEEDLLLNGVRLYLDADQLRPQEWKDLPFIPRPMVTGNTIMDFPFLDPLLIVLWDFYLEDIQWMLNTLPWRVVDRPIRTGRSILAVSTWITNQMTSRYN